MRCVLALNGICDVPLKDLGDFFVGVDGGTKHLLGQGITPDLIVGDLDSLNEIPNGVEVLRFSPEKDEIDSELALIECQKRGAEEVVVACWRGERADMELALYMLLSRFPPLWMRLVSEKLEVFFVKGSLELKARKGEKWSVLPAGGGAVVTLGGFKYEIEERPMPPDRPFGVSNVAESDRVLIQTLEGGVVVFRWKENPS